MENLFPELALESSVRTYQDSGTGKGVIKYAKT